MLVEQRHSLPSRPRTRDEVILISSDSGSDTDDGDKDNGDDEAYRSDDSLPSIATIAASGNETRRARAQRIGQRRLHPYSQHRPERMKL